MRRFALALLVAGTACSGGAGSSRSASDTTAPKSAPVAAVDTSAAIRRVRDPLPDTPARDADQRFLHRMLDHYEATLGLVHDQMMVPAGHAEHGGSADPATVDSYLDVDKRAMLALLDTLYGEAYSPRPRLSGGGTADTTYAERIAGAYRAGLALVDRSRHDLRRPTVRAMADRIRQSLADRLREVDPDAAVRVVH